MQRTRIFPEMPEFMANLSPDEWTLPFWQAASEHRLVAPKCIHCGEFRMPPAPIQLRNLLLGAGSGRQQRGDDQQDTRAKPFARYPHTQFTYLQSVWDLLIGHLIHPRRPCGFGPLDEMIFIAEAFAPAKICFAPLVLATDIVHPAGLQARHHPIGAIAAIPEYHLARR